MKRRRLYVEAVLGDVKPHRLKFSRGPGDRGPIRLCWSYTQRVTDDGTGLYEHEWVEARVLFARCWLALQALKQRGREHETSAERWRRLAWTAKCVVSVLLLPVKGDRRALDDATIAEWDQDSWNGGEMTCWQWDYLTVATGWRRWGFEYGSDSAP